MTNEKNTGLNRRRALFATFIGGVLGSSILLVMIGGFLVTIGSVAHQIFATEYAISLTQWTTSTLLIVTVFCYAQCNMMNYRIWRDGQLIRYNAVLSFDAQMKFTSIELIDSAVHGMVHAVSHFFQPIIFIDGKKN